MHLTTLSFDTKQLRANVNNILDSISHTFRFMVVQLIPSRNGNQCFASEMSLFCRIHKSKICSFQYWQENGQLNLDSCSAVLNAPGWNLFKTPRICKPLPTSKQMAYGAQCAHTRLRMHFQMITRHNTRTQTTTTSSTWLNEQCKWGTTKRPGLCQTLWENCHLCSPAVCALILQSASTSAVQKHTLAWNCYKANCSLSVWDFVWPCCVCVCMCT